jgi:hypothetical protein
MLTFKEVLRMSEKEILAHIAEGRANSLFETIFVIKKFGELPNEEQAKLLSWLKSNDECNFLWAAGMLVECILDNPNEMSQSISAKMRTPWVISPNEVESKAFYFALVFRGDFQAMFTAHPQPQDNWNNC